MFAFIALVLTPFIIGIFALIAFEIMRYRGDENEVMGFFLFVYLVVFLFVLIGFLRKRRINATLTLGAYLHFFIPILPIFLWWTFIYRPYSYSDHYQNAIHHSGRDAEEAMFNEIYWACWIFAIASIWVFKVFYKRLGSSPSVK